ncbi:MAG: ABC transporter ATP-binding protein [Clostridiaceae bacterium]|nr:ABC transporter ATP-binding protein [Clostridiaceae bacterium]
MQKEKKQNPIIVLFSFAGEARGRMSLSVLLAILGELFGMAPFFVVAVLASHLYTGTATVREAALLSAGAAAGMALRALLCWRSSLRSHGIAFTILRNIRRTVADKMRRVPMGVMLETPTGHFKALMVDNVGKLEDSIAHVVPEAPSQIAAPLCSIILMFALDWRMGLASLVTVPLSVIFMIGMMRGYGEKMALYLKSGNEMNASLVEYVNGIQVIKAFGRTGSSYGKYSKSVNFFHDSTLNWWRQCWFWMAGVKAVLPSTLLGTLPLGAYLYMNGEITLPIFITCMVVSLGFIAPMMKLAFGTEQLTVIAANLGPIQKFLATPEQRRPARPAALSGSTFSFEDVSFAYDEKEVLHTVSFETTPGAVTAIVGPSGSGKSTIAKLMAGFWDATSGTVRYGGRDIREIPFDQLMGEVSYVAQDNFLFDMSIRENIRIGNKDSTDDEIEEAAKAANCHDFIMGLPEGYDTLAGDAGDRLSGGERQRITIARAMLKKASVVILDEATAYADPESESLIQQAIGKLVRGKTLIVVAHRLSTIRSAAQILVVSNGEIIGRGTQEQLLKNCPLYRTMWEEHIDASDRVMEGVKQYA